MAMEVGQGKMGSDWGKFWGKISQNHVKSASSHHKSPPGLASGGVVLAAAPPQLGWEARGPFRLGDRRQNHGGQEAMEEPSQQKVQTSRYDARLLQSHLRYPGHVHDHTCASTRFPCRARSSHVALTRLSWGSGVPYRFPDMCTCP